ncbi:MAG: FAD-dependent monooxygenase [Kineosporiaceae bacterium]|jgi:2-polyprenyl-6-methoxyphenol hydroxylase-like FAD-dependent oxidoreductase
MTPTAPATENRTDVVVGAGPTGLMLACERAFAGVRCRVLERRATRPNITRVFAVHARTLELLDARGLAAELISHGRPVEIRPAPGAGHVVGSDGGEGFRSHAPRLRSGRCCPHWS